MSPGISSVDVIQNAIAFGVDEQVITLMCSIGGFISLPRRTLLKTLLVVAFASAIPDVFAFSRAIPSSPVPSNTGAGSASIAGTVFLSEIIVGLLIGAPLVLFKKRKLSLIMSTIIGIILIIAADKYALGRTWSQVILTLLFASVAVAVSYGISRSITRLLKL